MPDQNDKPTPCPDGEYCPDARRYGAIHQKPNADKSTDEWSAGITQDNRGDDGGRHGIVLTRWPNKLRLEAEWPRYATGQAIAHELRKLADALEEADDV